MFFQAPKRACICARERRSETSRSQPRQTTDCRIRYRAQHVRDGPAAVFQFARTGRRAIHDGSLGSLPEKAPHESEICRFANPFSRENSFTYYDRVTLLDLIEDTP